MEALDKLTLVMFAAVVVPGFLSMRVYALLRPVERFTLKDNVLEAVAFGIVNAAIMFWAVVLLANPNYVTDHQIAAYFLVLATFLVAPVIWPIVLFWILNKLSDRNVILERSPTSWDHFFSKRQPCWIIVYLADGRRIGGHFGANSYASSHPNAGHLYLEELWMLDDDGQFVSKVDRSKGIVLQPDDYSFVEIFEE